MNNLYRSNYRKENSLNNFNYKNYEFYRSVSPEKDSTKCKKDKLSFKTLKCNTCSSLKEVECFLNNLDKFWHYVKLYKLLR